MTGRAGVLAELLLPGGCASCAAWIPSASPRRLVCDRCLTRLRPPPWPRCARCDHPRGSRREPAADCLHCRAWPEALGVARQAVALRGPALAMVHGLKYDGWADLARPMADRMTRVRLPGPPSAQRTLVPVPTTPARRLRRGYNQAELLARRVGRLRGWPVHGALERIRGGGSQTRLRPDERVENVRGAFRCPDPHAVRGVDVVLVDDVLTTGATAGEAARVLREAGAATVTLLVFARALPDGA